MKPIVMMYSMLILLLQRFLPIRMIMKLNLICAMAKESKYFVLL